MNGEFTSFKTIGAMLAVVTALSSGVGAWYVYSYKLDRHLTGGPHPEQLAINSSQTQAINKVETKVEKLDQKVENIDEKIDNSAKESANFRKEQRDVNGAILRSLGRLEGRGDNQ